MADIVTAALEWSTFVIILVQCHDDLLVGLHWHEGRNTAISREAIHDILIIHYIELQKAWSVYLAHLSPGSSSIGVIDVLTTWVRVF